MHNLLPIHPVVFTQYKSLFTQSLYPELQIISNPNLSPNEFDNFALSFLIPGISVVIPSDFAMVINNTNVLLIFFKVGALDLSGHSFVSILLS